MRSVTKTSSSCCVPFSLVGAFWPHLLVRLQHERRRLDRIIRLPAGCGNGGSVLLYLDTRGKNSGGRADENNLKNLTTR